MSEERLIQLLEQINEQTQKSTKVVVSIFLFSYHYIVRILNISVFVTHGSQRLAITDDSDSVLSD